MCLGYQKDTRQFNVYYFSPTYYITVNNYFNIPFLFRKMNKAELWNIFRMDHFPEIPKCCEGFTDTFFRVFKVVFYVFLIVVGICGVVASRGGLQILASILGDHDKRFSSVSPNIDMLTYEKYRFQEIKVQNHSNLLEYFILFVRKLLFISFSIQIFFSRGLLRKTSSLTFSSS